MWLAHLEFCKGNGYKFRSHHRETRETGKLCWEVINLVLVTDAHEVRFGFITRILEWVAMPSTRGSSGPRDWTHVSCTATSAVDSLLLSHQRSQIKWFIVVRLVVSSWLLLPVYLPLLFPFFKERKGEISPLDRLLRTWCRRKISIFPEIWWYLGNWSIRNMSWGHSWSLN